MKQYSFCLPSCLIVALCFAGISFAQDSTPKFPSYNQALQHQIYFTDAEQIKIQAIMLAERPVIEPILTQSFNDKKKIEDLIKDGNYTGAEVTPIVESQALTRIALLIEKQRTYAEIYAILAPSQQGTFEQIRATSHQFLGKPINHSLYVTMLAKRLGLTDVQQEEIEALLNNQQNQIAPFLAQGQTFYQELLKMTAGGYFNESQIRDLAAQYVTAFTGVALAQNDLTHQIYILLTPEQQARFFGHPPVRLGGLMGQDF